MNQTCPACGAPPTVFGHPLAYHRQLNFEDQRCSQCELPCRNWEMVEKLHVKLAASQAREPELQKYEQQLTKCAELLQSRLVVGKVKVIGLLEVYAALQQLELSYAESRKCVELYADDRHWAYAHTSMNLDLWLPTTHGYEPAQAALAEVAAMGGR